MSCANKECFFLHAKILHFYLKSASFQFCEQVTLSAKDQFTFQKGDTIGFTWTAKGVISYEASVGAPYCHGTVAPTSEGSSVNLKVDTSYSNRIYSFQALFQPANNTGYYGTTSFVNYL